MKKKLKLNREYYIALCLEYNIQNLWTMTFKQRRRGLKRMLLAVISLDLGRKANNINLDEYIDKIIFEVYNLDW